MLVFRRKIGESVILDGQIEVQLLEITGSRVKLGFTAPQAIPIVRKELYLTQVQNQQAVARGTADSLKRMVSEMRAQVTLTDPGASAPAK